MTDLELRTPDQAEAAFYAAFERRDLKAMMAVWSDDNDIACIHPHGPRLVGSDQIRDSWRQIMAHSPPMRFKVNELNTISDQELAVRFVNEHIHVGEGAEPEFTVLATNVYRRTPDGWRMVLHHASPTPESLQNIADDDSVEEDEATGEVTVH